MKQLVCEICKNIIDEVSICPFCGADIEIEIDENTNWEILITTNDLIEATNIKGLLEGSNIPVTILSQQDTTRMFTVGNLAIIKIMVPIPYIAEAKELLNIINSTNNEQ